MTERRAVLGGLAAGALALPVLALETAKARLPFLDSDAGAESCRIPGEGPGATYFPNAVVTSHEGRRGLFYKDFLAGKTVLVHFLSLAQEEERPTVPNLVQVQEVLGDRLGRDLFMLSLTIDPLRDDAKTLADFARRHGVRRGWDFLTGDLEDLLDLRARFFVDRVGHGHHYEAHQEAHQVGGTSVPEAPNQVGGTSRVALATAAPGCSRGLLRYGNEAIGLWGSCPAQADPHWIARRLSWVLPAPALTGAPRRGGPFPRRS